MLLPVCHHHSSLPPKPLPVSYFPSSLPRNLFHHPHILPNSPLLRQLPTAAAAYGNPETLPQSAIKRIADKLRSLGYVEDDQKKPQENNSQNPGPENGSPGEIFIPLPKHLPKYRVGHTIDQSWSTPENPIPMPGYGKSIQRYHELRRGVNAEREKEREKRKGEVKEEVPTMAELTLTREELRRLRDEGIKLKKKIKLGKAGITEGIVNGIHERWRTTELVRIACEDICRLNMKRTHDLLERKTGGLVVWRSGGNLILYRGVDYKYPYFDSDKNPNPSNTSVDTSTSSDMDGVGKSSGLVSSEKVTQPRLIQGVGLPNRVRFQLPGETELAEVADRLLDGLGPRFTDWWGYDPLPVDADLLPATVSGYRRPFRLLPYGIQPKLTNDEMTILKRLGNPLPCHFALGRNRKLQGLAASMVKLWEKCEIAKIAVKRGVQNTNSELMAEELKLLTGGTLLSRDREFIVFYRGKDFLSAAVSSAIEERRRSGYRSLVSVSGNYKHETVDPMGKEESNEIMDKGKIIVTEPGKPKSTEVAFERTSNKLERTLEKKAEAEKILAELEKEEVPQQAELDKEGITEEERFMLRKIGLKMKPFLLLGRRGVFAGTVENMHLHWKYRELVKIICGGRSTEEVYKRAQILEAESGGILVAVERVSKGYAIIVYRGKNYERPASLRPQTLLTKRQAMKRSIEAQRRESLKLHVLKLGEDIEKLKLEAVNGKDTTIQSADQSNFDVVREGFGAYSSSFHSNGGIDVSRATEENEFRLTDTDLSSESDVEDSDDPVGMNIEPATLPDEQKSRAQACFVSAVNAESDVHQNKTMIPFVKSMDTVAEISVEKAEESIFAPRARRLSNRDRLILRKHALKMKKRPVLAVGRSNIVTGVAKTIKAHFEKYPLAIVNVKGRAKGTSVQEVVFKLEQETESVMVSQEPSKVILYRGWGLEKELGQNTRETLARREGGNCWPVISPELMSAIRLECGLQSSLAGKKRVAQQALDQKL